MVAAPPPPGDPAAEDPAWLFAGTVPYYLRYRPRYPQALFAELAARFGLAAGARVLDLGCGPGFLALPLAALGAEVFALDPQPEMLAAGRAAAAAGGAPAITWIEGTAEDLDPAALAPLRCATLGRSFHWMQRERVLELLDRALDERGAVVLVEERRPDEVPWRQAVRDHLLAWHGGRSPVQERHAVRRSGRPHREVLQASPFCRLEVLRYPVARRWSIDEVVGYVYSTSSGSPRRLGAGIDAFEAGLRERLAALPGAPVFEERVEVTATLASRPPA